MADQTFGGVGDITATLRGGTFGGDSQGRDITAVLISRAAADANVAPNTPITIESSISSSESGTVESFGDPSPMRGQLARALANDATPGYLTGIAPEEIAVTGEEIAGGSGQLAHNPIVPDKSTISITDTTSGDDVPFSFAYGPDPTGGGVTLNWLTGQLNGADSTDYTVDYTRLDYDAALTAAEEFLEAGDAAALVVDSMSSSVGESLQATLESIRPRWELALGGIVAQPNATNERGEPVIDAENYTDSLDYDGLVVFPGGVIVPDTTGGTGDDSTPLGRLRTLAGGLLGTMAANDLTGTIYHDEITGYDDYRLTQSFTQAEIGDIQDPGENTLRGKQLAPIGEGAFGGGGAMRILDDRTSSTATDWLRTHHRRQVADTVLLNFRDLASQIEDDDRFQTNSQLDEVRQSGLGIFEQLAADGVIISNTDQFATGSTVANGVSVTGATPATNIGTAAATTDEGDQEQQFYDVVVSRAATNALEIQFAYVPTPVTKSVDINGVVYDAADQITDSVTANTSGGTAASGSL